MVKLWKNASNEILRLNAGVDVLMSDDTNCCCEACPTPLDTAKTYTVEMTAVVSGVGSFNYSIPATWTTISGYDVLVWSRFDACTASDDCFQIWNKADYLAAGGVLSDPSYDDACFILAASVDPTGAPCPTTLFDEEAPENYYFTAPWEIEWTATSGSPSDAGDCTKAADWTFLLTEDP